MCRPSFGFSLVMPRQPCLVSIQLIHWRSPSPESVTHSQFNICGFDTLSVIASLLCIQVNSRMYSQTQPDFTRNLECMSFTSFYFHSFTEKSSYIAMASAHHKPLTWFPFLGNGFGEFCICVEVAVSHGNNAFFVT